jgi:hypothetical protein
MKPDENSLSLAFDPVHHLGFSCISCEKLGPDGIAVAFLPFGAKSRSATP